LPFADRRGDPFVENQQIPVGCGPVRSHGADSENKADEVEFEVAAFAPASVE
jgi:hypothetical protein